MDLVDLVLFHHLYLFFERSIFVPILCWSVPQLMMKERKGSVCDSVYCVGKMEKTQISFKLLTQECAARFPTLQLSSFGLVHRFFWPTAMSVASFVLQVLMRNPTDATMTSQYGTIWQFYNKIFLLTCKGGSMTNHVFS